MRKISILFVVFSFLFVQIGYSFYSEDSGLFMPGKSSTQETVVEAQNHQSKDKPKVFKTNLIFVEHSPPSQSESVGKKIFNALNLALSVISIPFLFTGPTPNPLSNYAINYPLVQHSGETISSAISDKPREELPFDTGIIYEVTKTKPLIVSIPKKKECQWIAIEQSDKKLLEFQEKVLGRDLKNKREVDTFFFKALEDGETMLHLGCINSSGETLMTFSYKIKVAN